MQFLEQLISISMKSLLFGHFLKKMQLARELKKDALFDNYMSWVSLWRFLLNVVHIVGFDALEYIIPVLQ